MVTPLQTAILLENSSLPLNSPHLFVQLRILFRISKGHSSYREGSYQKQGSRQLAGVWTIKTCFLCSFTYQV